MAGRVSLIIITHVLGERQQLCLAAIAAHRPAADETILVIDSDADTTAVGFEAAGVRKIVGRRAGRAAARNDGAKAAEGDILLFVDGDILTAPDFIARHLAAQANGHSFTRGRIRELIAAAARPSLAAAGPGFPGLVASRLAREGFTPEGFRQSASLLEAAVEVRHIEGLTKVPDWIASAGANFSVARNLWQALGGQEERFGRSWGCEDLEFAYRVAREGTHIHFVPEATAWHLSHSQPNRWRAHAHALALFQQLHEGDPQIGMLGKLLAEGGSLAAYLGSLSTQYRTP